MKKKKRSKRRWEIHFLSAKPKKKSTPVSFFKRAAAGCAHSPLSHSISMAGDERRERLKRLREEAAAAGAVEEEEKKGGVDGGGDAGDGDGKTKKKKKTAAGEEEEEEAEDEAAPVLRFRNYAPTDKKIEAASVTVPAALAPDAALPDAVAVPDKGDLLATVGAGATFLKQGRTAEEDAALLAAVAPKKPAWDLKRDIAPKLAQLERRTQRAVVELVREKEEAKTKAAREAKATV